MPFTPVLHQNDSLGLTSMSVVLAELDLEQHLQIGEFARALRRLPLLKETGVLDAIEETDDFCFEAPNDPFEGLL